MPKTQAANKITPVKAPSGRFLTKEEWIEVTVPLHRSLARTSDYGDARHDLLAARLWLLRDLRMTSLDSCFASPITSPTEEPIPP